MMAAMEAIRQRHGRRCGTPQTVLMTSSIWKRALMVARNDRVTAIQPSAAVRWANSASGCSGKAPSRLLDTRSPQD